MQVHAKVVKSAKFMQPLLGCPDVLVRGQEVVLPLGAARRLEADGCVEVTGAVVPAAPPGPSAREVAKLRETKDAAIAQREEVASASTDALRRIDTLKSERQTCPPDKVAEITAELEALEKSTPVLHDRLRSADRAVAVARKTWGAANLAHEQAQAHDAIEKRLVPLVRRFAKEALPLADEIVSSVREAAAVAPQGEVSSALSDPVVLLAELVAATGLRVERRAAIA